MGIVVLPDGLTILNEELIKAGLAWWDERHAPTAKDYRSVEIAARAKRRGLWSDSEPVPPWEWRETTFTIGQTSLSSLHQEPLQALVCPAHGETRP